ncbi:anaerobic ribonucleoside-triphosphate reductase activating protein [Candidatus Wolfebacteria bacterium]|nr:anaerobic ribonucleoside-triphosphate reductase activating protein [Candidatus Wolfebacteria bacterium]
MKIGGFQKTSLTDYPGKVAAIIFTQGCNFRCGYCHNPELVSPDLFTESISEKEILSFFEKRRGQLDAMVVTGGEPLIQDSLEDFLKKIKKMGYLIKLDTNGSFPEELKKIIEKKLVDYLAMDIKAPLDKYKEVSNSNIDIKKIKQSIDLIMNFGLNYEFRTTVVKSQLKKEDLFEIAKLIKPKTLYILQKFIPSKTLNPNFLNEVSYSDEEFKEIIDEIKKKFDLNCIYR